MTGSTSGTTTFNYNRNQIILMAMRKLGAIASGETPDNQSIQDFSDQLNIMVKAWMASGIHIWTLNEGILFTTIGQAQYNLSVSSTDVCVDSTLANSYAITTITAGANPPAGNVVVASATGATNGMRVGITLASGNIFWGTISSIVGTTINFTPTISGAANSGANVYFISATNITRPLRIPQARRWSTVFQLGASLIETPMVPMSRLDYEALPNKTQTGTITQHYYTPQGGANNFGYMFLWPVPVDTINNLVKFTYYRPIQDFNNASNIGDFPVEWIDALMWNLAKKMATEYDCPIQRYQLVAAEAENSLSLAAGFDREPESTYFGVDFTQLGR